MSLNSPRIVRFPIAKGERTGPVEIVADMSGTVPDGVAFCNDGSFVVTCYHPDAMFRVLPDGNITVLMDDFEGLILGAPTNVCFGGPNLSVLFWENLGR